MSNVGKGTTGTILQGAGTGASPTFSTATYPSTATGTGKILRADGTNWAASTATYPDTATGTGKILRADGTNWVATTATYPDTAGTSGNVLTSNGTNWTSAAPAAGTQFFYTTVGTSGSPQDATTSYLINGSNFLANTIITSAATKIYVPVACTLDSVRGTIRVAGTLGTGESSTLFIRKNDTTNTNVSTAIVLNATDVAVSVTGLAISMAAGDFFQFGFTTPTFATNPTVVGCTFTIST